MSGNGVERAHSRTTGPELLNPRNAQALPGSKRL